MTPYLETPTYVRLLARKQDRHAALVTERLQLKGIKKSLRTPEQHRRFECLSSQIKTAQRHVDEVIALDLTPWYLLEMLIESQGTLWTDEEKVMWRKTLGPQEGRGEQALKRRHGLPEGQTRTKGDLIKWENGVRTLYEEVKNLEGRLPNGRYNVQNIQTANDGTSAHAAWVDEMYETQGFGDVARELRRKCIGGEISDKTLRQLPSVLQDNIKQTFAPSRVLPYQAIYGATHTGFIRIPQSDFDAAWEFDNITKYGPKYSLKTEYLVAQLRATVSASKDAADKAA